MNDLEKQVREIQIRTAANDLRAKYCWYVTRGDVDRIADLFTPDGVYEFIHDGKRASANGREAVRKLMAAAAFPGAVFPMVHNLMVMFEGERVYGACSMTAKVTNPNIPQFAKRYPEFAGYYHDEFKFHDGEWRFAKRGFYEYFPAFQRSGLGWDGLPETGLSADHKRKPG